MFSVGQHPILDFLPDQNPSSERTGATVNGDIGIAVDQWRIMQRTYATGKRQTFQSGAGRTRSPDSCNAGVCWRPIPVATRCKH